MPRLEALKKESEKRTLDSIDLSKALITTLAEISSNGTLDARERDQEIAPIVIILDALDEIPFGFQRDAMIEFLNDLAAAHLGCLRVLITSRRDIDIEERLASKGIYKSQEISTDHVKQDVGIFVEGQIARHPRLKLQSARVKKMISNGVVDIAGGM